MHERGLAIDFTSGRSVIRSRSSPAFRWLSAHAASYGLHNLRSEPWHWSTNGN
jgi:LAS superfamily LD-carboxypeptidase LdcB